jgi:hypothetical protein
MEVIINNSMEINKAIFKEIKVIKEIIIIKKEIINKEIRILEVGLLKKR